MNKKTIVMIIISCCLFSIINLSIAVPPEHSNAKQNREDKSIIPNPPNDDNTLWSPYWKITNIYTNGFYMYLYTGWNLVGWYQNYTTTASNLSNNIEYCTSISCWDAINQTYHTFITGGPPSFDFTISKGMGIFIDVSNDSIWYGV